MLRTRLASCLALAIPTLASCALGTRPWPATDASQAVALRFAWPLGLSSRVSFERQEERKTPQSSERSRWAGSYRMTVLAAPEGRLIRYDDFDLSDFSSSGSGTELPHPALREASSRVSMLLPSLLVDDQGDVVRVEGADRLGAEVDRLLAPLRDTLPVGAERKLALLDTLFSEQRLAESATEAWNALVGTWAEVELELGVVYVAEDTTMLPLVGGFEVPTVYEVSLLQELPCPTASGEPRCVELEMRSYPKPEALASPLGSSPDADSPASQADMPVFEELQFETSIHLVTEPATLVPHSLETSKELRATLRLPAGDTRRIETRDRRAYRFRYAD